MIDNPWRRAKVTLPRRLPSQSSVQTYNVNSNTGCSALYWGDAASRSPRPQ
jgi:hypothetical protein